MSNADGSGSGSRGQAMEKVPKFKTVKEEAEFWETHSPLEFPGEFEEVKEPIVDRRARKKGIYLRVDPEVIVAGRTIGAQLGVGYQTLFRMWIMEGLARSTAHWSVDQILRGLPLESRDRAMEVFRRAVECELRGLYGRHRARSSS
jgi:hypothetical protein